MERYTIYCTKDQTRKAFKLGAPLQYGDQGKEVVYIEDEGYMKIPTAGQMCGWLEEQYIDCFVGKQTYARFVATVCVNEGLISWASLKVVVNMSRSLYNITAALQELQAKLGQSEN